MTWICPYCKSSNITQTCEGDPNTEEIIQWYDDYTCQDCENQFKFPEQTIEEKSSE